MLQPFGVYRTQEGKHDWCFFRPNNLQQNNRIETSVQHSSCSKVLQKIRSRLTVSDEAILAEHPDKEDFLLPDINIAEAPQWDDNIHFSQITIPTQTN